MEDVDMKNKDGNIQTHFEMVIKLGTTGRVKSRGAIRWGREKPRCRLEGIGTQPLLKAREVGVPRSVNRSRVFSPMAIHLFGIVGIGTVRERVVRGRGRSRSGEFAVKKKRALLEGDRKPGPASCATQTPQSVPLQHSERIEDEGECGG